MQIPSIEEIACILSAHPPEPLPGAGYHKAAVLIPLISKAEAGDYNCLLTQRTDFVEHHKGQVSFPGGAVDGTDRDIVATALREAEEEVGIDPAAVRVLGRLGEIRTPSGFIITPVVGYLPQPPHLRLGHSEVAEAFTAPLSFFADQANMTTRQRTIEGISRDVFYYFYGEFTIWGITALIIRNFIGVLENAQREK